jgi:hypothetical protein
MNKRLGGFLYNIGDLVEFTHGHLGASVKRIGIVVEQSLRMTKDNVYKIRTNEKDYFIPRTHITLLSKAGNSTSK